MPNFNDRGIIKWQPFNSCFNCEEMMQDIEKAKNKQKYPILSEDQLSNLEHQIINAYNLKLTIKIFYYYDGNIKNENGQINYLNTHTKKLYLNNIKIYFNQILKISEY